MVLFDLLTAEGREAARIRRAARSVTERYAQPEVRQDAAERLRAIGTPEAIYQLARRFTMTAGNLEQDDQEKRRVRDMLVEIGERAAAPIQRYLRTHDEVTWAMDALGELLSPDELAEQLLEVLQDGDPVAIRGGKAVQILGFLAGIESDKAAAGLARCLESLDDTVRLAAVDALRRHRDADAREALLRRFVAQEEDSARVRIAIAELFVESEWEVRGYRSAVEENLPSGFRVTSRGRIVRGGTAE